ncbi:MAG TPA: epoxide hydrolase [Burkholderiales bacterium]|nr:epoxide hydrolase [Burkholderiales bacterium]
MAPTPFRLAVPDADLADLRARLSRTRFPDEPPLAPWSTGTSLAYLKTLVPYWEKEFDWRHWEAKLNSFPQYKVRLGGIDLHYLHVPSKKKDAMPLLLSHGWPGSVFEFYKLIPLLTEHFTIVAPSLPGYTLSFTPGQKRFAVEDMADLFAALMTDVLGYKKFGAQGGDWGAFVTSVLGWKYPERLTGIHLNLLAVRRDPKEPAATPEEKKYIEELNHFLKEEIGYQWIQGTKPQTLAYGLTDSPSGLAAWIVEKFHAWTDHDGNVETAISRDEMLANISLYWFTGAIGSSFWPYYARMHGPWPIPPGKTVDVPTAYAAFPREILRPPRSLAARSYTNIKQWTEMDKGGHFAALEQPDALARDVESFLGKLESRRY